MEMNRSIEFVHFRKEIGITVSNGVTATTIWLTRKEAEKLIELLRIELACSKEEG